jgi:hypothetical protein
MLTSVVHLDAHHGMDSCMEDCSCCWIAVYVEYLGDPQRTWSALLDIDHQESLGDQE